MILELLLVLIVILLGFLIYLEVKKDFKIDSSDLESALTKSWLELEFDKKIGAIEEHAKEIKDSYRDFELILRVPTDRGSFGELALETIFSEQLPEGMYGIRERILDGKIPDAHIKSTVGYICIDSKFPLDNFKKMKEAETPDEKSRYQRQFKSDVKKHLEKIVQDYVCPDKGSAEFSFAFIPSEGVFYHLIKEENEMLRDYARRGVQVVSPLTLSHKIELIKASAHAKKLSENAEKVNRRLQGLSSSFSIIDNLWSTFYDTHLKNLKSKADDLDEEYRRLKDKFDGVADFSEE